MDKTQRKVWYHVTGISISSADHIKVGACDTSGAVRSLPLAESGDMPAQKIWNPEAQKCYFLHSDINLSTKNLILIK